MYNEFRNDVLMSLHDEFLPEQLRLIDEAIAKHLIGVKLEKEETLPSVAEDTIPKEIAEFLIRKEIKGCASGTIADYRALLMDFYDYIHKDLTTVTDIDLLAFLHYREMHPKGHAKKERLSKRSVDGMRRILSSFYTYLHDTGKIPVNPTKSIDAIKYKENVRQPLTDMELEMVRNACETPREKALFEVLYATGGRVQEIVSLNVDDIDIQHRKALIVGKGNKERFIYFNAKALIAIKNYLAVKDGDDPALFVTSRAPYHRLGKNSVEIEIKHIGERSGIGRRVFPHLLRHTFATDSIKRGARIEQVQVMLGHACIDTTRIYAQISDADIQYTYQRCNLG